MLQIPNQSQVLLVDYEVLALFRHAIPVFNKLFFPNLFFFRLNLLCTMMSHIIITIIPSTTPVITLLNSDIPNASGIKSKQIIDIISPDANDNMKLKNLFDELLNFTPIIPPKVVPNVPKNSPSNVLFNISMMLTPLVNYMSTLGLL